MSYVVFLGLRSQCLIPTLKHIVLRTCQGPCFGPSNNFGTNHYFPFEFGLGVSRVITEFVVFLEICRRDFILQISFLRKLAYKHFLLLGKCSILRDVYADREIITFQPVIRYVLNRTSLPMIAQSLNAIW